MPHSPCVRCATCDGFPCLVHAKSDAEVLGVRPALEHANVTLLTNAEAVRLETNAGGTRGDRRRGRARRRARDVHRRSRRRVLRRRQQRAAAARLGERRAPGRAGQRLRTRSAATTCSTTARRCSRCRRRRTRRSSRRRSGSTTSTSARSDFDYPLGNIQMVGKSSAEMYRGEKPLQTRLAPERTLENVARHAVDFWLSTEDLPRPENRVTLRDDGAIQLSYTPSNEEPKQRLLHELKSMLGHLGMHHDHLIPRHAYLKNDIPVAGCAHQAGTCRFGADPATSVLNTDCRAHEVDNLYVVDTSFFPSIGAVNPALTAMANALRVGDHLLDRMGAAARSGGRACRVTSGEQPARDRRRRRLRRRRMRQAARPRGRRARHADRPPQLPPVPAAALPGGDLAARVERHRVLAAQAVPPRTTTSTSSSAR